LGGGFHHCSRNQGGGFCPYADITMVVNDALQEENDYKLVMIIDLDAHQVSVDMCVCYCLDTCQKSHDLFV